MSQVAIQTETNGKEPYEQYGEALRADILRKEATREQKILGWWHNTVPRWLDTSRKMTLVSFLLAAVRLLVLFLIPATPILSKRIDLIKTDAPLTNPRAPVTWNEWLWALIIAVAGLYAWYFDKVRRGSEKTSADKRKMGVLLQDSAGTISALSHILSVRPNVKATNTEYRQHLQRVLKRIHTEVSLLLSDRDEAFGEVTLLLYGNDDGTELQIVARSSDAKVDVQRVAARKMMAHYVAQTGCDWVEHDFRRKGNKFPKRRVSKPSEKPDYRSILFKPLLIACQDRPDYVYCQGILCIHSHRPYHFWLQGNGDTRFILLRLQPYFALLELLLQKWPSRIAVEQI